MVNLVLMLGIMVGAALALKFVGYKTGGWHD